MAAERWRYGAIEGCKDAVSQPVDELDARAPVKKAYESALSNLKKELIETLGRFSKPDNRVAQAVDEISKQAASMWLDIGTQRYRIRVVMPESSLMSPVDKVKKAQEEYLDLVVTPELRRYGNAKGQDLDKEETVKGCKLDTARVSLK
jgi:hypothetical protein